jgi:hypothetical protein
LSAAKTAQAGNAYNPLANVLQGIGTNPYFSQGVGRGGFNYGGTDVIPNSTFTGGISPSEMSNYQSMGIF